MGNHKNWSYAEVFSIRCHDDPSAIEHYYHVYGDRPSPLEMHSFVDIFSSEQRNHNPRVGGSSPSSATRNFLNI